MNVRIISTLIYALLAACTVGPDYVRPTMPIPANFKEIKGWKQAQPLDNLLPDKWWEVFKDAELNALEEQINNANQSIAKAEAQYRQAQTLVRSAAAAYFPTATTSASANRSRSASNQSGTSSGVKNTFGLAISALWAPDLWGSVRRQVESSEAEAQASAANLQALRLTIQTTLAQSYFQLRILDAQKKLLNDTTVIYEKTVKLTKSRYEAGMISNADVIQAETQLQSTQAQTINLGVQRAQLEHAIAILIGKSPADLSIAVAPLNTNLPSIPLSLPSQLLERRPDIDEAERQAAAANAQIGVAKAAYFPNLNLAASNGQQSPLLSTLLSQGARYWALGPAALALPLFDGGFRAAQMQQSIAAYDASVANYREAVLLSFQQVEDNLAALRILEQETLVQNQVVASAHKALKLTNTQYQSGAINYLNVMVNQVIVLTNEKKLIDLQGQRLNATVLLAQALGGGWNTTMLPSKDEAGGEFKWQQFLPIPIN